MSPSTSYKMTGRDQRRSSRSFRSDDELWRSAAGTDTEDNRRVLLSLQVMKSGRLASSQQDSESPQECSSLLGVQDSSRRYVTDDVALEAPTSGQDSR